MMIKISDIHDEKVMYVHILYHVHSIHMHNQHFYAQGHMHKSFKNLTDSVHIQWKIFSEATLSIVQQILNHSLQIA